MNKNMNAQPTVVAEIDYIEVDMPSAERTACGACDDARSRLDKAIASVSPELGRLGVVPKIRHLKVRTLREAELLKVRGSPSIRIGRLDLYPEHSGENGETRIWRWQGREFSTPPLEMLTQALLRIAANTDELTEGNYNVPAYFLKFIAEDVSA